MLARVALLAALLQGVAGTAALRAQIGPPTPPGLRIEAPQGQEPNTVLFDAAAKQLQGRLVRKITFARPGRDSRTLQPLEPSAADPLVRSLETHVGKPFEPRQISADCANLWSERRMVVAGYVQAVDDEVGVVFVVEREEYVYERVEFRGLVHFDRPTVDGLLGITSDRQVTSTEAEAMRKVLLARYHRDGYALCAIRLEDRIADDRLDDKSRLATAADAGAGVRRHVRFQVDEGDRVTVREIHVLGNRSFASLPAFGVFGTDDYLLRDAHLQSDPAWGFGRGGPYSREVLEEDLDRLRLFYRRRGFLDATVDLVDVLFTPDHTEVDLVLFVEEGPRYRIQSIAIEHIDAAGHPVQTTPLYPPAEIAKELKIQPGEFYNYDHLMRDFTAIQDFYGRRGHPPASFPGMEKDPSACKVLFPPRETYCDGEKVALTFQVFEGVPKALRDVVIRGNQYTKDAVIRRRTKVKPGERIDMVAVHRSLRNLEQTRYFGDPLARSGPRMQLEPVPGNEDTLDLAIDLEDGETGEIRWAVALSTGQGANLQMTLRKNNFDISNFPSSPNPVTAFSEFLDNKAFHGGGQTLTTVLSPGSRQSSFRMTWSDPDIFNEYEQTHELRVSGHRDIRRMRDGYTSDALGADVGLSRNFSDEFNLGLSARHETIYISNLAQDATSLAYAAEGRTELRGLRLSARYRDVDDLRRPTSGLDLGANLESVGGPLGGEADFWKFTQTAHFYRPVLENSAGHRYVLHFEHMFGVANAYEGQDDVFLTERFHIGGANLRGFDYHGAGPKQFDRPLGGEATYTATLELSCPLVATRMERDIRDREILRWVAFTDAGLLGLSIDDPTFLQLRGSYGIGLRIEVPYLELPIALDLAWPWASEETDSRRQFFFSIATW